MVSVVVPIYNEEELIVRFHEAVAGALKGVVDDWEVVYVNDGSTDSSLELLRGLQAADSHVVVVELSRNWGHMGAISAGLQTARGRAVILMDGDFQDPPEVIPQLIEAWRDGAEVVVGVRRSRQESRKLLALLFPLFYRVLGTLQRLSHPAQRGHLQPHGPQGAGLGPRHAGEEPLSSRLARMGGLQEHHCLLRSQRPRRRRRQALLRQPHQVRDGCHHQLQLQTAAPELRPAGVFSAMAAIARACACSCPSAP